MTEALKKSKADFRSQMRKHLSTLTEEQRQIASANACERIIRMEAFLHADVVMMYMPLTNEVDVTPLALRCFRSCQSVCVPKVDWERRDMYSVEITSIDDNVMETDEHGIRVPRHSRLILPSLIDLIVVPGLAFDSLGRRLGRGGGYFDRFLARLKPKTVTVGIVFDQQIIDSVPAGDQDIAVDFVVSDQRTLNARSARSNS